MKNVLESSVEKKENYGHDVTLIIELVRHAKKGGPDAPLAPEGVIAAKEFGKDLKEEFPDSAGIKAYHSGVRRAEQTAEAISESSQYVPRKNSDLILNGNFSPEFLKQYDSLVNETDGEAPAVQWYLDSDNERPDEKTYSSREASGEISKNIEHLVDMSGRLKEHSKVNIVLVSHSGVADNFIVDALGEERKGFVERMGGGLGFLEGARIIIDRKDKENVSIKIQFRGQEKEITLDQLKNITDQANLR